MKIKNIPQIFNTIITLFLSFIAVWTVLITFRLSRPLAFFLAVVFAFIISAIVFILSSKPSKASLQIIRKGKLYALMDKFNMCTIDEIFQIFSPVFNNLHISANVTNEHITLDNGLILHIAFFPSALSDNEVMSIYRKYRSPDLIILSNSFTSSCYSLAKKLNIKLFCGEDIFQFLESNNALPEQIENKTTPFYDGFISRLLERKNGIRFIFLGFTLIIIAFAVFYPIYYYIMGILSLTYGFALLIFAKKQTQKSESLQDILSSQKENQKQ